MHKIKHKFGLIVFLIFTIIAVTPMLWADEISSSVYKNDTVQSASNVKPQLSVALTSINYSSSTAVDEKSQGQAEMVIGLKKTGLIFSEVEGVIGSFSGTKTAYGTIPEAYIAFGTQGENFFAVGIKKQKLSFIDQYYHIGLYQSYLTNDFISYRDQGFIGPQAQLHGDLFGVRAGFQKYFFPNQGPQVREENNSLVSGNRWAKRPPQSLELFGRTNKINYEIREYRLTDIMSHEGETISIFAGPNADRPWVQMSYARKPLNDVPLSRETFAAVTTLIGHARVSPVVTYDEVRSIDFDFDQGLFKSTFSYLEDAPINTDPMPGETISSFQPLKIYGLYLSAQLDEVFSRRFEVSLAAAHVMGGEVNDKSADGEESLVNYSTSRTQFKDPITLGISADIAILKTLPLGAAVRWTYDRTFKGSLLSTEFNYATVSHINFRAGFDILGLESEPTPDSTENFLSQNQANDRLFAGVGYAF